MRWLKTKLPGHDPLLQLFVSVASPLHSFPPFVAFTVTSLERDIYPFPQVVEHEDQLS